MYVHARVTSDVACIQGAHGVCPSFPRLANYVLLKNAIHLHPRFIDVNLFEAGWERVAFNIEIF